MQQHWAIGKSMHTLANCHIIAFEWLFLPSTRRCLSCDMIKPRLRHSEVLWFPHCIPCQVSKHHTVVLKSGSKKKKSSIQNYYPMVLPHFLSHKNKKINIIITPFFKDVKGGWWVEKCGSNVFLDIKFWRYPLCFYLLKKRAKTKNCHPKTHFWCRWRRFLSDLVTVG